MANAWKHPDAAASGCFILFVGVDVLIDPRREAAWQERRHEGMPPYGCVGYGKNGATRLSAGRFCYVQAESSNSCFFSRCIRDWTASLGDLCS